MSTTVFNDQSTHSTEVVATSADVPLLVKTEVPNTTAVMTSADVPVLVKTETPAPISSTIGGPVLVKTEPLSPLAPGASAYASAGIPKTETVLPPITLSTPKISFKKHESVPRIDREGFSNQYTFEVENEQSSYEVRRSVKDFKALFNELGQSGIEIPESIRQLLTPVKQQIQSVGHDVKVGLVQTADKVADITQPIRDIGSNAVNNLATAGQNLGEAGANVVRNISQNVVTAGSKIASDISEGVKQTAANVNADIKEAGANISAEVNVQKQVAADTAEVAQIDLKLAAVDAKNVVAEQASVAVENTKQAVADINATVAIQATDAVDATKQAVYDINDQLATKMSETAHATKQAVAELPFAVSDQYKKLKEERIPRLTQYLQSLVSTTPGMVSSAPVRRFLSLDTPPSQVADNIDWKESDMPWLNQKIAVVTGASSGIGWAVSKALAAKGCHVVMAVRNPDKARVRLEELKKTLTNPFIEIMILDLTRIESVRQFANEFQLKYRHLDFLINNAGVMATPERHTADGIELQMATNHFGHFALTALLLDSLKQAEKARIVTVASLAHKGAKFEFGNANAEVNYNRWQVYQQTSLANLLFSQELQRRLRVAGLNNITSLAAHPGFANTHASKVGAEMEGSWFGKAVASVTSAIAAQSPEMGALPILYAATAPHVRGGDYCGPKGMNNLWGYPTIHKADDNAYDSESAARLWTLAATTTGLEFDFSAPTSTAAHPSVGSSVSSTSSGHTISSLPLSPASATISSYPSIGSSVSAPSTVIPASTGGFTSSALAGTTIGSTSTALPGTTISSTSTVLPATTISATSLPATTVSSTSTALPAGSILSSITPGTPTFTSFSTPLPAAATTVLPQTSVTVSSTLPTTHI